MKRFRRFLSADGLRVKCIVIAASVLVAFLTGSTAIAEPHGGRHGQPHVASRWGSHFAGGQRHGSDAYTKAASDDREKLLNSKLKDICRGC